mgnify:CR=1 FL=1
MKELGFNTLRKHAKLEPELFYSLCDELGINIYSFPMKYHPIMDEKWFSNRDYIDQPHWSRKAIRTIQKL